MYHVAIIVSMIDMENGTHTTDLQSKAYRITDAIPDNMPSNIIRINILGCSDLIKFFANMDLSGSNIWKIVDEVNRNAAIATPVFAINSALRDILYVGKISAKNNAITPRNTINGLII